LTFFQSTSEVQAYAEHRAARIDEQPWRTERGGEPVVGDQRLLRSVVEHVQHIYDQISGAGAKMEQRAGASASKRELERVKREIQKVIDAIVDLLRQIEAAHEPPPLLHPSMANLYRSKVEELAAALQREDTRLEPSEMLRGLIEAIVLTPQGGQLRIELRGNLAAMSAVAQKTARSPEAGDFVMPVQMVAGARNKLYRQLCWAAA
jgi:vacuolar-type H+-ATPase subunit E/Vma4